MRTIAVEFSLIRVLLVSQNNQHYCLERTEKFIRAFFFGVLGPTHWHGGGGGPQGNWIYDMNMYTIWIDKASV